MKHRNAITAAATGLALTLALGACEDAAGPDPAGTTRVAIGFSAGRTGGAAAAVPAGARYALSAEPLVLEGTNGTLVIEDLRIIVAEFELKREESLCEDSDSLAGSDDDGFDDDGCEEFEAPPAFVDVPLMGGTAVAVTSEVPAARYRRVEFEVEDLDDDEDDPQEAAQIAALLAEIRSEFPEWPREASLMVEGTFTPTGGTAAPFRAFFEAEIEVELEFEPALDLTAETGTRTVTIEIDPGRWFGRPDGTLLDLSQLDFASTGRVLEFEVEMEHGFEEIEF